MEQFRNKRIALLATKYNIDCVQEIYLRIFTEMMDSGIMRKENPAFVSMSFAAPVSLLIQMCDREPEREKAAMKRIEEFFQYFSKEYSSR